MIDPKLLRQSADDVAANLARRGFEFDTEAYLALEERRKSLQVETEKLQGERNASAKNIGKAKKEFEKGIKEAQDEKDAEKESDEKKSE